MGKNDHLVMEEDHMEKLYSSGNPIIRWVFARKLKGISGFVADKNLKIFDAGCGEGQLIEKLHSSKPLNQYFGADVTSVAVEKARERCPYAAFKQCDLMELDYPDECFDVVICTEVLEHIYEYEKVISQLKRVLKKDGVLIINFPHESLWTVGRFFLGRRPIKVPDHVHAFSPKSMSDAVGLPIVEKTNLPINVPYVFSLGAIIKYKK
ncbi:MAG: class I SAM-dependent methyltransferase [Patescibacteria group bacterium]|nr:class I SAM-dependent methyltransferase [Patescibacteria group bacterium]